MSVLISLWRLLDRQQRRYLIALQLLSLMMALSTVSGIAALLPFFIVLTEPSSIDRSVILHFFFVHMGFSSQRSFCIALGVAFCAVVVLANMINLAGSTAMYRFSNQVGDAFQISLFKEYMRRDFEFHSRSSGTALSSNVLYESKRISGGILQYGLTLNTSLVTVAFILASLIMINSQVALVGAMALGIGYTTTYLLARGKLLRNGMAEGRHLAERHKILAETFGAIKEIIVLRAHGYFVHKFTQSSKPISKSLVSTMAISQSPRHVLEIGTVCGLVFGALYLSGRSGGSGQWVAQLSFVGLASYRLLPALHQAFTAIVRIRADRAAFATVGADLQLARINEHHPNASAIDPFWHGRPKHEIRLDAVCFRYAAGDPLAISDITLRIPARAIVGLVGNNGSGKTTLIDVIAGLLTSYSGSMEVDGVAVNDANRDAWRSAVAYVPQQIYLLDATVAENIALGASGSQIDDNRLRTAVRLAQLEECIGLLPNQYQEVLGERGCRLSGGQRQRLGIARALYRGASLLILDEATSALDADAEQEIVDMLDSLRQERTVLVIAHRLSSLRHCDLIFEMESGRLARSGGSHHLMAPGGVLAVNINQDRHTVP